MIRVDIHMRAVGLYEWQLIADGAVKLAGFCSKRRRAAAQAQRALQERFPYVDRTL